MDKKLSKFLLPLVAAAILADAAMSNQSVEYNDNSTVIQNNIIELDCEDCSEKTESNEIDITKFYEKKHKQHDKSALQKLGTFLFPAQEIGENFENSVYNEKHFHKPGCTCFGAPEHREYRRLNNPLWAPNRGICSQHQSYSMFRRLDYDRGFLGRGFFGRGFFGRGFFGIGLDCDRELECGKESNYDRGNNIERMW